MTGQPARRSAPGPTPEAVASLLAEADREARAIVRKELVGQLVERYRAAMRAQVGAPAAVAQPPAAEPMTAEAAKTEPELAGPELAGPELAGPELAGPELAGPELAGPEIPEPRPAEPETAWYLYAIVAADAGQDLPPLVGVEERPVELVSTENLCAVTAEVPLAGFRTGGEEPDLTPEGWLPRAVRAHERVIEQLCTLTTALPFRFGALYPSRGQVRAVLDSHADQLTAELRRLDGTAEWGVKVRTREESTGRGHPTAGEVTGGTAWMRQRRDAAAARERARHARAETAADVKQALTTYARETVVRAASRPDEPTALVFDAVYLIPRSAERDFHEAIRSTSARYTDEGLRFEVTGPWPPYHFVRLPTDKPTGQQTEPSSAGSATRYPEPEENPGDPCGRTTVEDAAHQATRQGARP
ncbi:GvpL/GvpF family gas vesicle protein [Actinopolymorpha alba]|uniref:GvpL/GvpF family gas vesicle protein n=1 Tax=Actinopolymorpha alba TaxID=533267 RepID=UPI0003A76B8F|nr:GvpL/GvpF family gas vesicle protein [Actinopolymorpha alba]